MHKKMRNNFILIVLFAALSMSVVTGCTKGSGVVKNGNELNTSTKMSMIYDEFTGYKEAQIKVIEGQPVEVNVSIVTEKGSIDAYIAKDNNRKNNSYEGHDISTSEFSVTLKEQGVYTLCVDTKNHSGSYSFSW
jgi:hypothetical protein